MPWVRFVAYQDFVAGERIRAQNANARAEFERKLAEMKRKEKGG